LVEEEVVKTDLEGALGVVERAAAEAEAEPVVETAVDLAQWQEREEGRSSKAG